MSNVGSENEKRKGNDEHNAYSLERVAQTE